MSSKCKSSFKGHTEHEQPKIDKISLALKFLSCEDYII